MFRNDQKFGFGITLLSALIAIAVAVLLRACN